MAYTHSQTTLIGMVEELMDNNQVLITQNQKMLTENSKLMKDNQLYL